MKKSNNWKIQNRFKFKCKNRLSKDIFKNMVRINNKNKEQNERLLKIWHLIIDLDEL